MATIAVSKQVVASAEAVWAVLADFGNVDWIPGAPEVRVEGDGPGMRRFIAASDGQPIVETLLWIDPSRRALSYEIANNPMPVSRFVAVASVSEKPDEVGHSTLSWEVDYDPIGDDTAAREAIEAVYGMIADWVRDFAQARRQRQNT